MQSANDEAPAFEIMTLNPACRWVRIGALWEQTSTSTGEVSYQGKLDDPKQLGFLRDVDAVDLVGRLRGGAEIQRPLINYICNIPYHNNMVKI